MKDVLFLIGSESDTQAVEPGLQLLSEKGISFDLKVMSAHRNLEQLVAFLQAYIFALLTSVFIGLMQHEH